MTWWQDVAFGVGVILLALVFLLPSPPDPSAPQERADRAEAAQINRYIRRTHPAPRKVRR